MTISSATKTNKSSSFSASKFYTNLINGTLTNETFSNDDELFEIDDIDPINDFFIQHYFFIKIVVEYIGGFVCKKLLAVLKCEECKEALTITDQTRSLDDCQFIKFVSRGKLIIPSKDVVKICLAAENYLQTNVDLKKPFNIKVQNILNNIFLSLFGDHIFQSLDSHVQTCDAMNNHACLLIKCVMSIYIECILSHAARLLSADILKNMRVSRQQLLKSVHFLGS